MTATEGLLRRHGPLDAAPSSPILDARRELMIAHLADWREVLDPCAGGHTEHGPEAHRGQRLVRAIRSGYTPRLDMVEHWLYADAVAFIKDARSVGASIEASRHRKTFIHAIGKDDRQMFFEVVPA